jgi:hypothetical protein
MSGQPLVEEFLAELKAHLWREGWILFEADEGFGLVNREAVANWPRTSSNLIKDCFEDAAAGDVGFPGDEGEKDQEE